ncbi:MAG: hypothetical protein P4L85_14825 [Paludisphaera borealis]|uniref:hypothetical protein n=1 Tax=Paludisphaera borealis TaxID=1387353 RepID=UPI0028419F21|nr:hypothetical protein [Paludisphaera borealis]MDR3620623.1 hypothetical protein [Paludisphaera borealis]
MTTNGRSWDKVKGWLQRLRPWVDPGSYRPLILLVVVALGVLLGPLALDVVVAMVFSLPPWFRKAFGQGLVLSILGIGVIRLWRVKPSDAWPIGSIVGDEPPRSAADRWIPWVLRLGVLSLAYPMLSNPDGFGFSDWDFVLDKFEALRRTILVWGQFPWWNPWSRGGFPLASEPQIGAISMATPLVLALGTPAGLGVSAILCLLLAVEGAYRLAWLWFREPWAAAAAAIVYGLNGGVVIDTSLGYILAMSYCSVPWLAYFAFRIGRRFSDGLWLGFWMAFVVLNGIQYMSLYAAPLTAAIWLRAFRVQPSERRKALLLHTAAAVGVFLLMCGWRLSTILLILLDDKRERVTYWNETPFTLFHYLIHRPSPHWTGDFNAALGTVFGELTCYVGPVVLALVVVSLAFGWRWWHTLALACFWLAIGSLKWYQPSAWLMDWPFIGSAHVVTRWRFLGMLGLGLAVGSVVARWRGSRRWAVRALAASLVGVVAVDFLVLGHQQFPLAFSVRPDPELFPGPPVPEIVNVKSGLGYPCSLRGYGVIQGYEPMLSYYRNAPTLRLAREDPEYRGEAWTDRGTVEPIFWSPNRLIFQVEPGETVHVNQNPSSWWWANGRPAFPGRRCAELLVPFVATADAQGRLVLEIHPRGLSFGIGLHVAGAILIGLAWMMLRLRPERSDVLPPDDGSSSFSSKDAPTPYLDQAGSRGVV